MGKLFGKESDIIAKYNSGLSMPQVAEIYGVRHQSIDKMLRKHNVKRRNKSCALSIRYANYTKVSGMVMDMIDGWLLGDGSIINTGTKQCYFQHVSKHEEYIRFVEKVFISEGIKCNVGKYLSKKSKTYFWKLSTFRTTQFKEIYARWYKNRTKIIPKDLILTSPMVKNWIMDDGSLDKRDGILSLHVNAFKIDECWDLANKICDIVSIGRVNVIICKGIYPRITISRVATNKLLDSIGCCEVQCFKYKWNKKVLKKDINIGAIDA